MNEVPQDFVNFILVGKLSKCDRLTVFLNTYVNWVRILCEKSFIVFRFDVSPFPRSQGGFQCQNRNGLIIVLLHGLSMAY